MAFFCRINQSKLKSLSNQFKRHYFQISHASSLGAGRRENHASEYLERVIPIRPADPGGRVRFYAAPVQFQGKAKEEKNTSGPRLNEKITAEFVRIVSDDGHTIVSLREALQRARELHLDLVEVQQKANPPVCKIMDFHREKFKKQVREKDRVKSKAEVSLKKGSPKEIRFTAKTEEKDLRIKADMVKRLMERGYRVKCSARGSEGEDLGGLLSRLSAMIEDEAVVESGPSVEKGQAYVVVRHVKFGPPKKGGGGKASKVSPLASAACASSADKEEMDPEESEFVAHLENSKETWSVVDGNDDFDKVFDMKDDANLIPSKSTAKKMDFSDRAVAQSRPSPNSGRTSSVPPSLQDSSIKAENRYKKVEPATRFQPTNVMNKGPGARDSHQSETQIRDQRRHPPTHTNFSPSMRETRRYENNTSPLRNIKHPPSATSKPDPSHRSDPGPSKTSFGIFSSQNANAPGKQDAAGTNHQSNRGPPFAPSNNRFGASENTKFPATKSDENTNKGQKSWGIFSKDS